MAAGTETSSAFPPVLNKPTIVSPFGPLLANTCWLPSPPTPHWLSREEAEVLLDAKPDANVAPDVARTHLERIIQTLPALNSELARVAAQHAEEIREAHRRVRKAARLAAARLIVEPKLPVDVLGVYLYLPVA